MTLTGLQFVSRDSDRKAVIIESKPLINGQTYIEIQYMSGDLKEKTKCYYLSDFLEWFTLSKIILK